MFGLRLISSDKKSFIIFHILQSSDQINVFGVRADKTEISSEPSGWWEQTKLLPEFSNHVSKK